MQMQVDGRGGSSLISGAGIVPSRQARTKVGAQADRGGKGAAARGADPRSRGAQHHGSQRAQQAGPEDDEDGGNVQAQVVEGQVLGAAGLGGRLGRAYTGMEWVMDGWLSVSASSIAVHNPMGDGWLGRAQAAAGSPGAARSLQRSRPPDFKLSWHHDARQCRRFRRRGAPDSVPASTSARTAPTAARSSQTVITGLVAMVEGAGGTGSDLRRRISDWGLASSALLLLSPLRPMQLECASAAQQLSQKM